ncbi:MAG: SHOCT domain-containing protein [Actinobacteria bacterium]|nr:SHOCT domain-containing protein [Actinomycetota bacterium]MCG2808138.1 SHOCT domain-containing protein [Coriobacteriia bacterium]
MMGYGRGYGYGCGNMMGDGWFGGLLFLLFGAVVLVGIVLLVIWAVRASGGGHPVASAYPGAPGAAGHDEAVAIAKRRFAGGEITREQFDEIMRTLGG